MNRPQPWWQESGPGHCEGCECYYQIETGYYCSACDAPLCPACIRYQRVTDVLLCDRCGHEEPA